MLILVVFGLNIFFWISFIFLFFLIFTLLVLSYLGIKFSFKEKILLKFLIWIPFIIFLLFEGILELEWEFFLLLFLSSLNKVLWLIVL